MNLHHRCEGSLPCWETVSWSGHTEVGPCEIREELAKRSWVSTNAWLYIYIYTWLNSSWATLEARVTASASLPCLAASSRLSPRTKAASATTLGRTKPSSVNVVAIIIRTLFWCDPWAPLLEKHPMAGWCISIIVGTWSGHQVNVPLPEVFCAESTPGACKTSNHFTSKHCFQSVLTCIQCLVVVELASSSPVWFLIM